MKKLLYAFIALLMVAACQNRQQAFNNCRYVDSVVEKACIVPDLDRALALTDSFGVSLRLPFMLTVWV